MRRLGRRPANRPEAAASLSELAAASDADFQSFEHRRQELEARGVPRRIAATKAAELFRSRHDRSPRHARSLETDGDR